MDGREWSKGAILWFSVVPNAGLTYGYLNSIIVPRWLCPSPSFPPFLCSRQCDRLFAAASVETFVRAGQKSWSDGIIFAIIDIVVIQSTLYAGDSVKDSID